jgi:hypothetical protein
MVLWLQTTGPAEAIELAFECVWWLPQALLHAGPTPAAAAYLPSGAMASATGHSLWMYYIIYYIYDI